MKMLFRLFLILFFVFSFAGMGFGQGLERDGRWLKYNGNYIWVVGYDLQQLFNDASYTESDVKGYIDILATYGVTAFRVWVNTWFLRNVGTDYYPYTVTDGKFNLGTFDSNFFDRWKVLLAYAKAKGIMVEVAIFSEYPWIGGAFDLWTTRDVYWRNSENSQAYFDDVNGDFWPQFFTLNYKEGGASLTTLQKGLIYRVVSEFNSIGNVFFLIHNEHPAVGGGDSATGEYIDQVYAWQQEMADYAKSLGAIVFVHAHEQHGMNLEGVEYWNTRASVDGLVFHPYSSVTSDGNIEDIGTLWSTEQNRDKVLMFDESHAYDIGGSDEVKAVVREMFAAFTNGIYYLAYWDDPFTVGGADWLSKVGAVQTLKNISALVDWSQMSRVTGVMSAGPGDYWQGSAKSGEYYVFYFTGTPTDTAARFSTLPSGTYNYKYYDTRVWNPNGVSSGQVTSTGGTVDIPAPHAVSWDGSSGLVLIITVGIGDFAPADCDVDGSDLEVLITNPSLIDLSTFTQNFGKSVCP